MFLFDLAFSFFLSSKKIEHGETFMFKSQTSKMMQNFKRFAETGKAAEG